MITTSQNPGFIHGEVQKETQCAHAIFAGTPYPPNTTALDLAQMQDGNETFLHIAAHKNHLPPGTTINDFLQTKSFLNKLGYTALREAVQQNHLPKGTTAVHLVNDLDTEGGNTLRNLVHVIRPPGPANISVLELLKATSTQNPKDIRKITEIFSKRFPIQAAQWAAAQIQCQKQQK